MLIVAHICGIIIARVIKHVFEKRKTTEDKAIVYSIIEKSVYWTIMFVALFMLPSIIGFETAAIIAAFGSVLFAIGLGLQGTLADLATGIMLLGANTFKLNDYIEIQINDKTIIGRVKSFGILYTSVIDESSGVIITVPNRILYESPIKNHSTSEMHVVRGF